MVDPYVSVHQAYPSLKPLAAWTRDLGQRVSQFQLWAETARPPKLFWLSGFTFPNGFLTAVLQSHARQQNVSCGSKVPSRKDHQHVCLSHAEALKASFHLVLPSQTEDV